MLRLSKSYFRAALTPRALTSQTAMHSLSEKFEKLDIGKTGYRYLLSAEWSAIAVLALFSVAMIITSTLAML